MLLLFTLFYFFQCLFNSLASALGYGFPYNTFLHSPADLFSDFFQPIYSYTFLGFDHPKLHTFNFFHLTFTIGTRAFDHYRLFNHFSDNPLLASYSNTNFHFPPVTQLFNIFFAYLVRFTGPLTGLTVASIIALIPLFLACLLSSGKSYLRTMYLFILVLISYPCLFALTRANLSGLLCSSSLILSMILVYNQHVFLALLPTAIALSIRPNWLPLVVFMLLFMNYGHNLRSKISTLLYFLIFFAVLNLSTYSFVRLLYPEYDFSTFLLAYKYYSSIYEYGDAGLAFGSSLLGLEKLFLRLIFGVSPGPVLFVLRYANMFFALVLASLLILRFCKSNLSIITALLAMAAICMLATPVFADYHLLVFVGPALLLSRNYTQYLNYATTTRDLFFIAVTQLPFAYYLDTHALVGLGVVIRPLFALVYLMLLFSRPPLRASIDSRPYS